MSALPPPLSGSTHWAGLYVGRRWRDDFDCGDFILLALREVFGVEFPDIARQTPQHGADADFSRLREFQKIRDDVFAREFVRPVPPGLIADGDIGGFAPIGAPRSGDCRREINHLGLVVFPLPGGDAHFIHNHRPSGGVVLTRSCNMPALGLTCRIVCRPGVSSIRPFSC